MGSKQGLSSDYIYQSFLDSKGRVWFATDGNDVDILDKEGVHHFTTGNNQKTVFGFTETSDNSIWANVQGEGLYKSSKELDEVVSSITRVIENADQ